MCHLQECDESEAETTSSSPFLHLRRRNRREAEAAMEDEGDEKFSTKEDE